VEDNPIIFLLTLLVNQDLIHIFTDEALSAKLDVWGCEKQKNQFTLNPLIA
jgi:hypothetical protein